MTTPGEWTHAPPGDPPAMLQNHVEFQKLLELYVQQQPHRVLEVGVGDGGTLYRWLEYATPGALIVALDDRHSARDHYAGWTPHNVELHTITGYSHDPDTVIEVAEHRPFDWLFIDADHHDHAVRLDWRHYALGMAAPGAVVALHDIAPSTDPTIHVDKLWRELRAGYEYDEFQVPGGPGIGVIYVPETRE